MSPRNLAAELAELAENSLGFDLCELGVLRGQSTAGKLSTSVGRSIRRYCLLSALTRASLTIATLTVPRALLGATRDSQRARPRSIARPRASETRTRIRARRDRWSPGSIIQARRTTPCGNATPLPFV